MLDTGLDVVNNMHVQEHIILISKLLNNVTTNIGEYVCMQYAEVGRKVFHDASKCYGEGKRGSGTYYLFIRGVVRIKLCTNTLVMADSTQCVTQHQACNVSSLTEITPLK